MSGAVEVRRAREDDLAAIADIEAATFSEAWSARTFASLLGREDAVVRVAAEGGAVVGYAVAVVRDGEAEIANLAVSEARRGRGAGESLLVHVLEVLRERGPLLVCLAVRESNTRAADLYRRVGFRNIGRHRSYYADPPEDALVLARELSPLGPPAAG